MGKYFSLTLTLILASLFLSGCGETLNGISKDANRIEKGIKTVFIRDAR